MTHIPLLLADPISLTAIGSLIGGLAGAGGLAASVFGPKPKGPTMPSQPAPSQEPVGTPSTNKAAGAPSFLAAAAAPPSQAQVGGKSLLGQ